MMRKYIILLIALLFSTQYVVAQTRRVNPVKENYNTVLPADIKNQKKPPFTREVPGLKKDTIIRDTLFIAIDTTKNKIKHPKFNGVTIGVNAWDPIMRLTGKKYGGLGMSAEVSLWNKIFPYAEAGFGVANSTPEDMNFTYKCKPSIYTKLGAKYNFRHGELPDYQILGGANLGYSHFNYDITNIPLNSAYWGESIITTIPNQKSFALWGEVNFSLKVKIKGNLSMGWSAIFQFIMAEKKLPQSKAWYIPGFGSRNTKLTGNFSVFYTFPAKKKEKQTKDAYTDDPIEE